MPEGRRRRVGDVKYNGLDIDSEPVLHRSLRVPFDE